MVVVTPTEQSVHQGQDAMYTCRAFNLPTPNVVYSWQLQGGGSRKTGRDEVGDGGRTLRILDTTEEDNDTDVSCNVLRRTGELLGSDTARLIVLPALPSTEPPSPTPTVTEIPTTAVKTTLATETLRPTLKATTQPPSTAVKETTTASTPLTSTPVLPVSTERPTTLKATTRNTPFTVRLLPSSMPSDPHEGPTQNMVDDKAPGVVAPAVIGGIVVLLIVLVTGVFLLRRSRRKSRSSGDIENGPTKKSDHHMYEFVLPNGVDSVDANSEGSDEENHNKKKRHGNNHSNRDSLITYSRGTAPDSVGRYAKAVPKRDRIVRGGGHGAKPRREPVLTLSMNSLYEETTPTFVVTDGYVDELPQDKHARCAVGRGGDDVTDEEDEDHYVTLAHNPHSPESVKL